MLVIPRVSDLSETLKASLRGSAPALMVALRGPAALPARPGGTQCNFSAAGFVPPRLISKTQGGLHGPRYPAAFAGEGFEGGISLREAYLDNSATTKVCPQAAEKVWEMMTEKYGNPSSLHNKGLEAERELTLARGQLAAMLGCRPAELIFTSGGTEANNLAILGAATARKRQGRRVVVSAVEHSSVLECARELEKQGFEVIFLAPGPDGAVDESRVFAAINASTILVSMQLVNNEVGAVQPVSAMAAAVKRAKAPALVHIDAVQAFGKLPTLPEKLGADLMTISAHKIHGPKGVGALYLSKDTRILPRAFGGAQEKRLRPGTEAAPLIAGFGAAAAALPPWEAALSTVRALRDSCAARLKALPGVFLNSDEGAFPYILNFSVPGIKSETMLHHLAARGVFVSSGSACSRGKKSHVLSAMGLDPTRIDSAIRVSFCHENTEQDVDQLITGLQEGIDTLARAR